MLRGIALLASTLMLPVKVTWAGLTPTFVGLYQINFMVPENASTGNAVPVIVWVDGAASNSVTVAVQ
jgi:uncharacterized protein (TIGR03437 family)